MGFPSSLPEQRSKQGCRIAFVIGAAVVVGLGLAVRSRHEASRREFERKRAEGRDEFFAKVKAGDNGDGSFVFLDPRLIEMLASDADCMANLTTLNLSSVDLTPP
jgi:hypothetical protein